MTFTDVATGVAFYTATSARDGRFSIRLTDIPAGVSAVRVSVAGQGTGHRCAQDIADLSFDQGSLSGGPSGGAFRGVLSSSVAACKPGRMISLYEIGGGDPVFVGWNLTDASGSWTIAQAGGTYEAHADPALRGGGDTFTYCRALVSPAWSFEEQPEESA